MGKRGERRRAAQRSAAYRASQKSGDEGTQRREVFARVKRTVVAIVRTPAQLELALKKMDPKKDLFEPITILGTGFVVDPQESW